MHQYFWPHTVYMKKKNVLENLYRFSFKKVIYKKCQFQFIENKIHNYIFPRFYFIINNSKKITTVLFVFILLYFEEKQIFTNVSI